MNKAETKAKELVAKFWIEKTGIGFIMDSWEDVYSAGDSNWKSAKACAIICVDEILKSDATQPTHGYYELTSDKIEDAVKFWNEVKKAINNL